MSDGISSSGQFGVKSLSMKSKEYAYIQIIMQANRQESIFHLLLLLVVTQIVTLTTLGLVLTISCFSLHTTLSLPPETSSYMAHKYQSAPSRFLVTCTIGLSISSLAGLVATVLTFFEYKKKDNDLSSAQAHNNVFVIQYLCVAMGSLGSLVAFGLQLSYMVEVDPEITFQKCFSGVFAGLSQLLYIAATLKVLTMKNENCEPVHEEYIKTQRVPAGPQFYRSLPKAKNADFCLSKYPHRIKQDSSLLSTKKEKVNIKSTRPRNISNKMPADESPKDPLIEQSSVRDNQRNTDENEQSESSSEAPNFPLNVEIRASQSQNWRKKVPKLQMELIKPRQAQKISKISVIIPARNAKTTMVKKNLLLLPEVNRELLHTPSVLSHVNEGKIPEEIERREKPDLGKYRCPMRQLKQTESQVEKPTAPQWIIQAQSFEQD